MGDLNRNTLATEYQKILGNEIKLKFRMVQLAGGVEMSGENYAVFLQKILKGDLQIKKYLGEDALCTDIRKCPKQAVYSPIPVPWHYSYGHWVEDGDGGDGAFSCEGAFGFYPWIDKTKTYYGIISRHKEIRRSGYISAQCGQKIRRAFFQISRK
jgi:CubicO group peptidase (beta-lactamase class C family)